MKLLIINGPNLDKLHLRDKSLYSAYTLDEVKSLVRKEFETIEFDFYQSNSEAEIISKIHDAGERFDGIIINPGAYSHTSVGIRDAIEICKIPIVEVHLSNLSTRENFRNVMLSASKSSGYISGFKENGYLVAVFAIVKIISGLASSEKKYSL